MFNNVIDAWSFLTFSPWMAPQAAFSPRLPEAGHASPAGKAGSFTQLRYDAEGGSLRYKLYVPRAYAVAEQPLPLIVMLHGCGQDVDDFAAGTRMNELAEREGCLVAWPQQAARANSSNCWNWFEPGHSQRDKGEPELIAGMTRAIMEHHAVDASRVSIGGLSAGAAMAVVMGRTYPDLFTAVGCHSGLAHGCASDRYGAMLAMRDGAHADRWVDVDHGIVAPMIVFHGDRDLTVHVENSVCVLRQAIGTHMARSKHAPKEAELDVVRASGRVKGRAYTRDIYRAGTGQVVIEQWTVHGSGHAWSGGSRRGSYTEDMGPDASEEMMRFFLER